MGDSTVAGILGRLPATQTGHTSDTMSSLPETSNASSEPLAEQPAAPAIPLKESTPDALAPQTAGSNSSPVSAHLEPVPAIPKDEQSERLAETSAYLGVRRSDQVFIGILVCAALLLMCCHWVRLSGWGSQPVEIERLDAQPYRYLIDVNRAPWIEWVLLDGIGETLAQRIVEDREQNGPFGSIDDLLRVKGIGPKTLEKMRPQLTISVNDPAPPRAG